VRCATIRVQFGRSCEQKEEEQATMTQIQVSDLTQKAERLRALHHQSRILVLPNIWDPGGARMMEWLGYPAVATASAAVAYSLGHDDRQQITLDAMLDVVGRVAGAVTVPVTADMEWGYAEQPDDVAENMRRVLRAGAVGINLEDSIREGEVLFPIDFQCARIRAVREMARHEGVPFFINARTDVFWPVVPGTDAEKLDEAIRRARAYLDAGADCFYPILLGDLAMLKRLHDAIQAPINVLAPTSQATLRELEEAGIARLSLGPALMWASLTVMRNIAQELKNYGSFDLFTRDMITTDEILAYVRKGPMA
jgi:2-methylisocitrate lyase-like PEP mutase family enzyme